MIGRETIPQFFLELIGIFQINNTHPHEENTYHSKSESENMVGNSGSPFAVFQLNKFYSHKNHILFPRSVIGLIHLNQRGNQNWFDIFGKVLIQNDDGQTPHFEIHLQLLWNRWKHVLLGQVKEIQKGYFQK